MIEKRVSKVGMLYIMQMYAESNVTPYICLGLGICTLINPSVGDVIYFLDRLHHHLLGLVSVQIPACDRYRKSRYSPHTSDVQHAYVRYTFFSIIILLISLFRLIHGTILIQGMLGSCTHGMQMNGGLKMLVLIVQAVS